MPVLEVRNLTKTFGALNAIDNISFQVEQGEILVIVGGSGCGKTTTLRCIAGLEDLTGGSIALDGKVIASPEHSLAPEERGIGMVFQSYALWPHKTVKQNVAYGLQRKKLNATDAEEKIARILAQVGLSGFEDRLPSTLSGGQQQRVALARSAILQPRLLLLDEPLSNLDAKLREQMREELREMIKMFNMTAVHITHDQAEAMALADSVICMRSGVVEQQGSPRDLYRRPANRYVAEFIGASSFIECGISSNDGIGRVDLGDDVHLVVPNQVIGTASGRCLLAVRPENVHLNVKEEQSPNTFVGEVKQATFLGAFNEYIVTFGEKRLKANSPIDLSVGDRINISIDTSRIAIIKNI